MHDMPVKFVIATRQIGTNIAAAEMENVIRTFTTL